MKIKELKILISNLDQLKFFEELETHNTTKEDCLNANSFSFSCLICFLYYENAKVTYNKVVKDREIINSYSDELFLDSIGLDQY